MTGKPVVWDEVQRHHDAGHTMRECQARFGFSNDAWSNAVANGDLVPRRGRPPKVSHATREAVRELLDAGVSQSEAAFRLRLSKATVSYHARQLGIQRDDKTARRFDWSQIQSAYDSGLSLPECRARFGFSNSSWYEAVKRRDIVPRSNAIPIEELLVAGRRRNRGHIRRRLIKAGLKEERCELCGLADWRGQPLSVTLHHVNGDQHDHRLENLQFLCPNCHSQTPNFAGRSNRRGALQLPQV